MTCELCGKSRIDIMTVDTKIIKLNICVPCWRIVDNKLEEINNKFREEFKNWFYGVKVKE